jgi:precorrin-2 methylase
MKLYGVYRNLDMTEGKGPSVLDGLWFNEDKAIAEIQRASGYDVGHEIGDTVFYGSFWYMKILWTKDELSGFVVPGRGVG